MVPMAGPGILHPRRRCTLVAVLILTHFLALLFGCWLRAAGHRMGTGASTFRFLHHDIKKVDPHATDHPSIWACAKMEVEMGNSSGACDPSGGVVILTPVFNSVGHLGQYFKNLCSLSFPHKRISVVLGEDSSSDQTQELARKYTGKLSRYFCRVEVVDLSAVSSHEPWADSHGRNLQLRRRSYLAMSRNALLFAGLHTEEWVLWLDVDVNEMPPDIIERLIKTNKDITVPACMRHRPITGYPTLYDRNSWRETNESLTFLKNKPANYLMVEGYNTGYREYIHMLGKEGELVKLDGVGGCVLLIRADCHRKGLIFPPYVYNHHIETEGLAKMAKDMGFGVYGMPKLFVFHV